MRNIRTMMTALILASAVTSCATLGDLPAGVGGATFCSIAKPISWSPKDTRLTKEQVDTHNRKWKALCSPNAK